MTEQEIMVGGLDDSDADDEEMVPLNADGTDTIDSAAVDDDDPDDLFEDDPKQLRGDDDDDADPEGDDGPGDRDPGSKGNRDDETADEKRARRREERQRKKERRREAQESDRRLIDQQARQIAEANARLYALENRAGNADMARLDEAIKVSGENKKIALQRLEEARDSGDTEAAMQAQEEWADFRDQERNMKAYKEQLTKGGGGQARPSDAVAQRATAFMEKHKSWYDPNGRDQDSMLINALDSAVEAAGFDPATDEYWQELESRAAKVIPGRFRVAARAEVDDDDDAPEPPRRRPSNRRGKQSPNAGGGGDDRGGGAGQDDVNGIPREYIRELQNLGMWDDVEKRKEMIRRYRESASAVNG